MSTKRLKRLTLITVLEITRDQWAWLAANPTKGKRDYPGLQSSGLDTMRAGCALCEFVKQGMKDRDGPLECERCPLTRLWQAAGSNIRTCFEAGGLYHQWDWSTGIKRSECARKIADAARAELARLEKRAKP